MSDLPPQTPDSAPSGQVAAPPAPRYRMGTKDAAKYLGISESLLNRLRVQGKGPLWSAISSRCIYDSYDLDAFLAERLCRSTADRRAK